MRVAALALLATLPACGITQAVVWDDDYALDFDGSDCVEATGDIDTIGVALTVEAWVHALNTPPEGRGILVSIGSSGALWVSPDRTGFGSPDNLASTGWNTGSYNVFDDEVHHVAATWAEGEDGRIFVDGIPSGTVYNWEFQPGFDTLRIGCGPGRSQPFLGVIDEVRISSAVRYPTYFDPQREPFQTDGDTIALYHFDQGLGDRVLEQRDQFPGMINGATWTDGLMAGDGSPMDTGIE